MSDRFRHIVTIHVHGHPAPGGSKNAYVVRRGDGSIVFRGTAKIIGGKVFGSPVVTVSDAAGARNKAWRKAVEAAANRTFRKPPLAASVPLVVRMTFYMPRPKAHFRANGTLRDDAPEFHTQAPDALKLARSTEDALTGVLWRDDACNKVVVADKTWASARPGCVIDVHQVLSAQAGLFGEAG